MRTRKPRKKRIVKNGTSHSRDGEITAVQEQYCIFRGYGHSMRSASEQAGMTSLRGLNGTTGAEWERLPHILERIEFWRERANKECSMKAGELNRLLAQQARGDLPSKITDKFGEEYHPRQAAEALSHNLGLRKTRLTFDTDEPLDLSKLTDDELDTLMELQEKARKSAGDGGTDSEA